MVAPAPWRTVELSRRFGPLNVSVARYGARSHLPRHAHDVAQLFFVLDGTFVEHSCRTVVLRPGTAVFHPAHLEHSQEMLIAGARCVNVEIDPGWLGATLGPESLRPLAAPRVLGHGDRLAARRLAMSIERGGPAARAETLAIVLERLARAIDAHASALAERAAAWFREHWIHGSVRDAGRELSANPGHLARAFRARFGLSPREYLARLKLDRACAMLESGSAIAQSAKACGYADATHLAHAMTRVMGKTPRQIRRAAAT